MVSCGTISISQLVVKWSTPTHRADVVWKTGPGIVGYNSVTFSQFRLASDHPTGLFLTSLLSFADSTFKFISEALLQQIVCRTRAEEKTYM